MTTHRNGLGPVSETDFQSELERHAAGLRELLDREGLEVARLQAELADARAREQRVQRAIDILEGNTPQARAAATRIRKRPGPDNWTISEAKIAEVWAHIRGRTEPFTVNGLAKAAPGLSAESARRAIGVLRERELVRVSGRAQTGGRLLLPMPGTEHSDATGEAMIGATDAA